MTPEREGGVTAPPVCGVLHASLINPPDTEKRKASMLTMTVPAKKCLKAKLYFTLNLKTKQTPKDVLSVFRIL